MRKTQGDKADQHTARQGSQAAAPEFKFETRGRVGLGQFPLDGAEEGHAPPYPHRPRKSTLQAEQLVIAPVHIRDRPDPIYRHGTNRPPSHSAADWMEMPR